MSSSSTAPAVCDFAAELTGCPTSLTMMRVISADRTSTSRASRANIRARSCTEDRDHSGKAAAAAAAAAAAEIAPRFRGEAQARQQRRRGAHDRGIAQRHLHLPDGLVALGESALHGTAYYGNPKVAQLLVERGANMSAKNRNGQTALSLSIGYNQNAMTLTRPAITAVLKKLGATE